jgi:hypothetical protein
MNGLDDAAVAVPHPSRQKPRNLGVAICGARDALNIKVTTISGIADCKHSKHSNGRMALETTKVLFMMWKQTQQITLNNTESSSLAADSLSAERHRSSGRRRA